MNKADTYGLLLVPVAHWGSTFPVGSRFFHEGDVFARSMARDCNAIRDRKKVLR